MQLNHPVAHFHSNGSISRSQSSVPASWWVQHVVLQLRWSMTMPPSSPPHLFLYNEQWKHICSFCPVAVYQWSQESQLPQVCAAKHPQQCKSFNFKCTPQNQTKECLIISCESPRMFLLLNRCLEFFLFWIQERHLLLFYALHNIKFNLRQR